MGGFARPPLFPGGILVLLALGACKGNINDSTDVVAVTDRVSLNSQGQEGNSNSNFPSVSADGRFVAFSSDASNLVPGDTNSSTDVFVRDRLLGVTTLVSVGLLGAPANGSSLLPSISANGQFVAFQSAASNLVAGDTNGKPDIFVRDMIAGTTIMASVKSNGTISTSPSILGGSFGARISADGQFVVFTSDATDLVATPLDIASTLNVYRHHNVAMGVTEMVSVNSLGTASGNGDSVSPSLSADGSVVVFASNANNLVSPMSNTLGQIFVRPMSLGPTKLVSADKNGIQGNGMSESPSISSDGTRVVFDSLATNLVMPSLSINQSQVFLKDLTSSATSLVSVNLLGTEGTGSSVQAAISGNGQFVAFISFSSDLVPDDTNGALDVFWRDLSNAVTYRVSVRTYGGESHPIAGPKGTPALTPDGRFVCFDSDAADLVAADTNGVFDVFIRGPLY